MVNARKQKTPNDNTADVTWQTIFDTFGNSIRDVVPVASITERTQLVAALTEKNEAPSPSAPLVVHRADAAGLHRVEYTTDGVVWTPTSGRLAFDTTAARDTWTTSNSGLLRVDDRASVAGAPQRWDGAGWRPEVRVAAFTFTISGFTDGTLAGSAISSVTADTDMTTDASFITARAGTSCTVTKGFYLVSLHFELSSTSFTGRSFAEVASGPVLIRSNAQAGVGENAASVTAQVPVSTDSAVIVGRILKNSGANANVTGRLILTKLA